MSNQWFAEEEILQQVIFPDLLRGRKDFDLPHTKAVVHWMKRILESMLPGSTQESIMKVGRLDPKVMITAAYAHDWGYIDLFPAGSGFNKVHEMKARHMEVGAERIGSLLKSRLSKSYSVEQINRIVHLVLVHDKLQVVEKEDEILLVEADTLGALDTDLVKPTFSKIDNDRYLVELKTKRRPLFIHPAAIEAYEVVVKKRIGFYSKESPFKHPA